MNMIFELTHYRFIGAIIAGIVLSCVMIMILSPISTSTGISPVTHENQSEVVSNVSDISLFDIVGIIFVMSFVMILIFFILRVLE